jgi:hypothetical protein
VDYQASVTQRTTAPITGGQGAFRNGSSVGKVDTDFDQSYNPINSYEQGSGGGGYVVRKGDTLAGLAAGLYGDSSLWYKIAEANGLSGQPALIEGQSLTLPAGVIRNTNNASTFQPYDPATTIGDTSPTAAAAPPKKKGCGAGGQILLAIIAVAVALVVAPYATAAISNAFAGTALTVSGGAIAGGTAGLGASIAGAASAGAAGSIVSQSVGVATGIQDKFSWKAVALAAIGGGVGAGFGGAFSNSITNPTLQAMARGAAASAVTQGIGVVTGMQDKFSWAAVAAAGVGAGVGFKVGNSGMLAGASNKVVRGVVSAATALSNAATQSLLEGTNFGDNIRAALPAVISGLFFDGLSSLTLGASGAGNGVIGGAQSPFDRRLRDGNSVLEFEGIPKAPVDVVIVTAQRPNPILAAIRRGMDWLSAVASTSGDAIAEGIRRGNNFNAGAYYTNLAAQNYGIAQATGGMMRSSAQQMMAANSQRESGGPSMFSSPARALDMFKANAFGVAARGSMNAYVRSNDPIDRMNAAQAFRANTMAAGLASLNTAIVDTGVQGAQTYAMGVGAEAGLGLVAGRVIGTRAAAVFAAESNVVAPLTRAEVRAKIFGTAQQTGNDGAHAFRSYREAILLARNPEVEAVFLNRGYNRGLDLAPNTISPNRRPDVLGRYSDGRVDRVEVWSRTDDPLVLSSRNSALDRQIIQQGYTPLTPRIVYPVRGQ